MSQWLVTLGDFASPDGLLAQVGWNGAALQVQRTFRFVLPEERRVKGKGFTGACRVSRSQFLVCGFNAVYSIDIAAGECSAWLVRDDSNDLHDLALSSADRDSRLFVANTGHDRVDCLDMKGNLLERWSFQAGEGGIEHREDDPYFDEGAEADRPIYLRKLRDSVHPNAVHLGQGQIWVSHFSERKLCALPIRRQVILDGCPHDIIPWKGRLWTTTTDGKVWSFEPEEPGASLECEFDSFSKTGLSGWVRGLALTENLLVLGFTQISRMPRERWTDRPFEDTETGVLLVDRETKTALDWLPLESLGVHPKVYGIYPWGQT